MLGARARSYLHVNCAHCHQFGAGGTATIDLRFTTELARTKMIDARPVQGAFEIPGAHIITPGDPFRSVLYYRLAKTGPGHMPHLGSEMVDERGLRLMNDWIRQMPLHHEDAGLIDKLLALDETPFLIREKAKWTDQLDKLALEIAGKTSTCRPPKTTARKPRRS